MRPTAGSATAQSLRRLWFSARSLRSARAAFTLAGAFTACFALAQSSGTYQPAGGSPVAWRINENHTLLWDGQPYIPVGARIAGAADQIEAAKKAGFQDVVVDLPPSGVGWKDAILALEGAGMRYILSIDSLIPSAKGFAVEPEAYRVDGITSDRHVDITIPGATSALAVLVTTRDASVESSKRIPIVDGKFSFDVKSQSDLDQVLLVYPEQQEASHPDFWDGFDDQRDVLLTALRQNKPGRGLRGILNPLGRMFNGALGAGLFVPESSFYRNELAAYLENKYRSVETAERAWGIGTNDIDTFDGLARLVPLWSGKRGVGELWDPGTDNLYTCDDKHSIIWLDIQTVISAAATKRFERLVPAVQSVADVPVVQDWSGWIAPFEAARPELSGIGYSATGRVAQDFIDEASRPTSSLLRWKSPGWLICTRMSVAKESDAAATLGALVDSLESMGTRGWFFSLGSGFVQPSGAEASRRSGDMTAASQTPDAVYFPENAFNPASPKPLPAGKWWLPSPEDGNRIDYGAGYYGYQYTDGVTFSTVIWETNGPQRIRLRLNNPKTVTVAAFDSTDRKLKLQKNGVDINMDQVPVVITTAGEVPVPEQCFLETSFKFEQLLAFGESLHRDITEDAFFFKDAVTGYGHDPSGSFLNLRKRFWMLDRKMGRFAWIEAESTRNTNFSQIVPASGCSDSAVLLLHTPVTTDPSGFYATYQAPVRTPDDQQVWVAGLIPKEDEKYVTLDVAGQKLHIVEGPVGSYSSGYGWYRFGTTKVAGANATITLQVTSPEGAYMAIDAILLYPGNFAPNGIEMPDAIVFAPMKTKRK